jgi:hypothetical protein
MAGKFKVDLSGVQQFFIDKGDKIALGLCVLAMVLLVTMGVLDAASVRTAPNSTKSYAETMQSAAKTLEDKVRHAPLDEKRSEDPAAKFVEQRWRWDLSNLAFSFAKLFDMADSGSSKRLNPRVVSVLTGPESIDMKYIPGCYFAYDLNAAKGKQTIVVFQPEANGANPAPQIGPNGKKMVEFQGQPAIVTRPMRMVVVNCVFPMREQLIEFQNAFRMQSQGELFLSKDLPHVLGINILKREVPASGKDGDYKPFVFAKQNKDTGEIEVEVNDSLRKLFREALLDDENLALYSPFLLQGLTMPLPRLAILPTGQYPPVKLAGLEIDPDAPLPEGFRGDGMGMGGMAGGGGGGAGANQFNPFGKDGARPGGGGAGMGKNLVRDDVFPWKNLNKNLQDKLNDRTNVLDPRLVNFDPPEEEKKDAELNVPRQPNALEGFFQGNSMFSSQLFWARYPKPPMPVAAGGKEPKNQPTAAVAKPYDALVRFVDPTAEPGKTYQYMIQVRMANPNFGKKEDVAFPALAEIKELSPSPFAETPTITIPGEYYLYAVNQQPAVKVNGGSAWEAPKERDPYKPEHVAVQIHRWIDEVRRDLAIGDWCIAERIYLRRGDPVGKEINVEVPTWNSEENRFQLGKAVADNGGANPKGLPPTIRKGTMMIAPPQAGGTGGIPVNFAITTPPPVLVDFDGGKRELLVGRTATTSGTSYKDESASNLLILRADGTLIVRNTRIDAENSEQTKEREHRVETWKAKTLPLRGLENPGNPGMPFRPGPAGLFNKGG